MKKNTLNPLLSQCCVVTDSVFLSMSCSDVTDVTEVFQKFISGFLQSVGYLLCTLFMFSLKGSRFLRCDTLLCITRDYP